MTTKAGRWVLLLVGVIGLGRSSSAQDLRTVAEKSDFQATARHDEVVALCEALAKRSPLVTLAELGKTTEGRSIPLLVVSDPPVKTAEEAKASGKLIVLAIGNIHAGEVDGKEGLPLLARELTDALGNPLLKDLIFAAVPNFNPDGNERVSKDNRPGQVGPAEGMGQRENAKGLDLNRDFVKLEAPETRALVQLIDQWNPHIFIDCHTTNGSRHRYTMTHAGPKSPAGSRDINTYVHEKLLPAVGEAVEAAAGWKSFSYGNFNRERTRWESYGAEPRYGTTYVGLRNRIAILLEAYAYAPYKDRVLATRDFLREIAKYTADHKEEIRAMLDEAAKVSVVGEAIAVRSEPRMRRAKAEVLGFVEIEENGRPRATEETAAHTVEIWDDFGPRETATAPALYVIPSLYPDVVETLRRHGLDVRLLREDIELPLEVYRVESIERGERLYQGHRMVRSLGVSPRTETAIVPAGSFLVDVGGPLGALAVMLLEPRSDDSLATWNAFDEGLEVGGDYPVRRVAAKPEYPLLTARLEGGGSAGRTPAGGSRRASSRGTGGAGFVRWLDDAHFMQTKEGKSWKVHAATGRAEPVAEEDRSRIRAALAGLPTIEDGAAGSLSSRATFDANRKGAFVEHDDDLYYSSADGSEARRLTSTPGAEEMAEFSPDGKFVAFVRDNDLFVVDVATGTERALTTGGSDRVRHGKADWVYFEEIFNRRWKAFWWSPDSKHIAFLKIDDRMVPTHHVLVDTGAIRVVEETAYPRAGEPNPHVGFGIVSAAGGAPRYADLSVYSPDSFLISDVGWWPDSSAAYFYGQDRAQTWLDVLKLRPSGGVPERLFRETTKAWVESLGPIRVLKDGTFLITSERDGWKHLYRYNSDGSLENQVTSGDWEVRAVPRVDEESGWVYLTGTRDNPLGSNLYRARLDGSKIERLTEGPGSHATTLSPDGSMFVGIWSSRLTPPQAVLRKNDGSKLRALDDNSASDASDSGDPAREIVKIKTKDGFELEGELLLPANLDTSGETLYPVWLVTYGGPHMPTISDSWRGGGGGAGLEAGLVRDGYIVFRVDPSSASGKGARSAWRAYRKLGVQECEDINEAVAWLKQRPYVDGSRIGMSGHSYGGYLTAFCMTHSDLFAAGIAGAPVTDWHDYDSIYTERLMDTPQNNPEGYEASSVVKAANKLHGRLLILHGGIDDNVSVRNTMRFVHALQQANKDFELMIYPASRHGIFGGHYSRLQQEFIRRVLGGPKPRETGSVTAKAAASDR